MRPNYEMKYETYSNTFSCINYALNGNKKLKGQTSMNTVACKVKAQNNNQVGKLVIGSDVNSA